VPAYFSQPKTAPPWPAVLYNHSHGGRYELGKDEFLAGRDYLQKPAYAEALAGLGMAGLCIDAWVFGERRGMSESETFKLMLWRGQLLWGMMVFDGLKALEYLCGRPDLDAGRIGTLGMSMGSTLAWWLAGLDERIKVCVDLCCLTDFDSLIEAGGLDGHGIYYYVPGLLKRWSTARINALIAPRAHLALAGEKDRLAPLAGLRRIDRELRKAYLAEGAPEAWRLETFPVGHVETAAMRVLALEFLKKHL
jgi:dienelactone hydrolase